MEIFKELGSKIDSAWHKHNYDINDFPIITEEILNSIKLKNVEINDICNWVFNSKDFITQVNIDSKFGQPPLTVFANEKFYIEILFWLAGTTAIHQHGFTGTFYVLAGSSIHTKYKFTEQYRVNENLLFGKVETIGIELLEKGQYRKIPGGNSFIHSLFHLEYPSVSLVIRTYKDPTNPIQYRYYKPHIAINDFYKEQRASRQFQMLRMLKISGNPEFSSILYDFAQSADLRTLISVSISLSNESLITSEELENILKIFETKYGELIHFVRPIFPELNRVKIIGEGRKFVTDPIHRFFMALLMNATNRKHVDQIVKEKYPNENPAELIFRWIQELNQENKFNAKFDKFQLDLLYLMLKEYSFEEIINSLQSSYDENDIEARVSEIKELHLKIKNLPLFKVLF